MEIKGSIGSGVIHFEKNGCLITYYTDIIPIHIYRFTCGNRGEGNGKKLLIDSLKYININTEGNLETVSLNPVPIATDNTQNNEEKLKIYYTPFNLSIADLYNLKSPTAISRI
jgi:hypothetical protein